MTIRTLTLITVLAPLLGALCAGLLAKRIGKRGAHTITIVLMLVSMFSALSVAFHVIGAQQSYYGNVYTWADSGRFHFHIGFMIDSLTAVMMAVVTFVSLVVHIYSMGYMHDDKGYQRFFCYVSLFTFMMLMLVTANNFLQLFFGWEGVGLVSYLLISFWFQKDSAAAGGLKAFLVNRAGDCAFILGIAAVFEYTGSVDYKTVFSKASLLSSSHLSIFSGTHWSVDSVICILLFIGAMAKSAQMPLHVWLPESMEGPTPISALIHAATMVTAGVFLVARMSPLFQGSMVAMNVVLVIGASSALLLGLLAFVENDIKRIIAFSTMSQLGYMMAANGASAYAAGIFHLATHAAFKALLFLAAGAVIMAMQHEQDIRKMGGLRKYLPMTYFGFLIGSCALAAIPPFSGFYSKDAIIEAVHLSQLPGAHYAYGCLVLGAFVTAYYIFRAFFMTFHGKERFDDTLRVQLREYPSMSLALVLLSIPSFMLGMIFLRPALFASPGLFGNSFFVLAHNNVLAQMAKGPNGLLSFTAHGVMALPFVFSIAGVVCAYVTTLLAPQIPKRLAKIASIPHTILKNQYGFDALNDLIFVRGAKRLSQFLFQFADIKVIDHFMVNGSGRNIARLSRWVGRLQSGYLYHYVLAMLLGLVLLLVWMIF